MLATAAENNIMQRVQRCSGFSCTGLISIALLAILAASGCSIAPRLTVAVDAIDSGQSVNDIRYVLKSVVAGVDETDLHFLEYSRHIDAALQKRGMNKAASAEQANVEVAVNYGFKRQAYTRLRQSAFDDPFFYERRCRQRHRNGRCLSWYRPGYHDRYAWYDRQRPQIDTISSYRVFVTLEARLKDATAEQPALWTTRARAVLSSPDLRISLPVLLVAAGDFIGTDTGRERTVVLSGEDFAVITQNDQVGLD